MTYVPPAAPQPYLPDVTWATTPSAPPPVVATRADIQAVASDPTDQQTQLAAENAPLRVIYGRTRVGALIADLLVYQTNLILVAVWGQGEIDAVESVMVNDKDLPSTVTATHYTGTTGQTVNSLLVSAYAANGVVFNDALPGVAYSVFKVPVGSVEGFPTFAAIIRGRKVYDPRTATTVYSDTPALCLADFITSTVYGFGRTVDWASVEVVADANEALVGTEKRRILGLAIDQIQPTRQWCEALRTYAGCFIQYNQADVVLIPDAPSSSAATFTDANIVAGSMRIAKRGLQQVPTVVDVRYTDTTKVPWTEKSAIAKMDGVDAGTTPRRESQINLPGIQRYSQAYREAVERLNKLQLSDLSCAFTAFDEALAIESGDVITVSHNLGLSSKQMRVLDPVAESPGRWSLSAFEYDPAAYSDIVQAEPTYADTDLPDPSSPPALTGFTATEEVYQLDNGTWSSRILMTWDAADYAYLDRYVVEVYDGATLIVTAPAREAVYRTGPIQEGILYQCKVAAASVLGVVGEWAQDDLTAQGKTLIPGNVPSVSTFEVGGVVYVSWTPAIDIDIWRYEVRRGLTTETWDDAGVIDRVDALRLSTNLIPTGTWRVFVKALDSVGQYSPVAAYSDVTVTTDANAFIVDSYDQTAPTLTNMASFALAPTDLSTYYVTEDNAAFGTKYSSTLSAYTDVMATYHASVTSTWLGESNDDFGQVLSGQWTGTATVEDLSGSHTSYLGLSNNGGDGGTWAYTSGLSTRDTARFARLKHEALTTSTMLVTVPTQNIRLDAVPREEVGSDSALSTGTNTVTLTNDYVAVKKLTITPTGTAARIAVYDNIVLGDPTTFDVYIFDAAGDRVACDFLYTFQGI